MLGMRNLLWLIVFLIVVVMLLIGGRGCNFSPTIVESTPEYEDYDSYPDMDASAEYEPADTYGEVDYDDPGYYRDGSSRDATPAVDAEPALPESTEGDDVDTLYVVERAATVEPPINNSRTTPSTYATTPPPQAQPATPVPSTVPAPAATLPVPTAAPDGYTGKYYVIIGSYQFESNAFEQANRWEQAGYAAEVLQFYNSPYYRVSLGAYDSATVADELVQRLQQGGQEAYVKRQ